MRITVSSGDFDKLEPYAMYWAFSHVFIPCPTPWNAYPPCNLIVHGVFLPGENQTTLARFVLTKSNLETRGGKYRGTSNRKRYCFLTEWCVVGLTRLHFDDLRKHEHSLALQVHPTSLGVP